MPDPTHPFYTNWPFWLLVAALIPWTCFVAYYSRLYWYRTPIGRSLMLSKAVIVGVLLNSIAGWIFPGHLLAIRWGIFAVLITLSCLAGWYQFINLTREQRRARSHPDDPRRRVSDPRVGDRV